MKRFISTLVAASMLLVLGSTQLTGCQEKQPEEKTFPMGEDGTLQATTENTKMLGRTYTSTFRYKPEGEDVQKIEGVQFFNWTVAGFEVTFEGTGLEAQLVSGTGDTEDNHVFLYVLVDGDDEPAPEKLLELDGEAKWYTLCEGLEAGRHTVKVVRRDEIDTTGKKTSGIAAYRVLGGDKLLEPPAQAERKIEAFGDSITAGMGIKDANGKEAGDGYQTYAAYAARKFGADLNVTAISGNGLISSMFGGPLYNIPERFAWTDEFNGGSNGKVKWDYSKYQPDVVIINLGTNDVAGIGTEEDKEAGRKNFTHQDFVDEYVRWALEIREVYPNCKILGTLGAMAYNRMNLFPDIEEAAKQVNEQLGEEVFYTLWLEEERGEGMIEGGHPSAAAHAIYGEAVVNKITEMTGWTPVE